VHLYILICSSHKASEDMEEHHLKMTSPGKPGGLDIFLVKKNTKIKMGNCGNHFKSMS